MQIVVDGRKFVSRQSKGGGCKKCAFDFVGDCGLHEWLCVLPIGAVWRETFLSRFRTLYAEGIASEDHARDRYENAPGDLD